VKIGSKMEEDRDYISNEYVLIVEIDLNADLNN